jgi:hypothetical protein
METAERADVRVRRYGSGYIERRRKKICAVKRASEYTSE